MTSKSGFRIQALFPLLLACCSGWLFIASRAPVPDTLLTARGTLESISATTKRGHVTDLYLTMSSVDKTFTYEDALPHFDALKSVLRKDMPIEVTYSDGDSTVLWGLALNGKQFLSPAEAQAGRQKAGYLYLAITIGLVLLSLYFLFFAKPRPPA